MDTGRPARLNVGYTLSSEEFSAPEIVEHAVAAERAGFEYALISDHFHPWTDQQGNSPFVWSTLAAISQRTESLRLGTGVTCPILRMHPAIVAQAAATTASLLPGRFFLGVGGGERLNEHVTGEFWPDNPQRTAMLREAVFLIRSLWKGDEFTHHGDFFTVDHARIYSLPETPPPIYIAAGGPATATLAGAIGDGMIAVAPASDLSRTYVESADPVGPRIGQIHFCWDESEERAIETAAKYWPNAAWGGSLSQEVSTPADFEAIAKFVRPEDVADVVVCGSDPDRFIEALSEYADAGFDHAYLHQVGPRQHEAIEFFAAEVLPAFERSERKVGVPA